MSCFLFWGFSSAITAKVIWPPCADTTDVFSCMIIVLHSQYARPCFTCVCPSAPLACPFQSHWNACPSMDSWPVYNSCHACTKVHIYCPLDTGPFRNIWLGVRNILYRLWAMESKLAPFKAEYILHQGSKQRHTPKHCFWCPAAHPL